VLSKILTKLLSKESYVFLACLILLAILYPPRAIFKLHTDDFLVRAYVTGEQPDFLSGEKVYRGLANSFYFFGEKRNKTIELKEYGALPWWSEDSAQMAMFRPISAATHYVDHVILKGDLVLIQLQSFMWLVFLFIALRLFYKKIHLSPLVILLASLIFIIDLTHMTNFYWLSARNIFISTVFGLLTITMHIQWRESKNIFYFPIALMLFCMSLLSAEAGIAAGAYLLSYALFLDKQGITRGIVSIIPYGIIVILWRFIYQQLGYGSKNISLYVDPVNSLADFLFSFFASALLIITAVISATGSILSGMSAEVEFWYLLFGFCLLVFSTLLIWSILKKSAQVRFFYAGFLFSIIPFCALSTYTARSGVFAYIGFSALLAILIGEYLEDKKFILLKRVFIVIALLFHLFIPIIYNLYVSLQTDDKNSVDVKANLEHALPSDSDKYTVYLNYPSEVNAMFLPYTWKAEGFPEPKGLIRLVPGLNSYTIKRLSEKSFLLGSDYHFVLNQHAELKYKYKDIPKSGLLYGLREANGFTANNQKQYVVGEKFTLKNYKVEILELESGLPSKILVSISDHIVMHDTEWRIWNWKDYHFEKIPILEVGESLRVLNQWDVMLQNEVP